MASLTACSVKKFLSGAISWSWPLVMFGFILA